MQLLNRLVTTCGSDHIDVSSISSRVLSYWQLHVRASRSGSTPMNRRYEQSPCANCMNNGASILMKRSEKRTSTAHVATSSSVTPGGSPPSGGPGDSPSKSVTGTNKSWLQEQVTALSRGRLEGWRDSTTSDEFNSYASFKYRLVLSDIHLEVSDPRGRFVKTVSFFTSPRPVSVVTQLKSTDYSDKWQPCGTITLPKGANRASVKLARPVVAANIRIEYSSFYERPGSSKSSDGSFVVHCPRCKSLTIPCKAVHLIGTHDMYEMSNNGPFVLWQVHVWSPTPMVSVEIVEKCAFSAAR